MPVLYLIQNPFNLSRMIFQIAFGPNDKMGAGNFFFDGHLRGNALLDIFK